ncbi:MAG: ribonuclease P protein component [Chromatiales bacterium]|nr:MAG: ribonuclease P protein component [Chromatiales bacterium]
MTSARDFQRVFRNGRRSADRCFTVLFCHNKRDHPRLGLAIAKRRVRRATARNRLKRLVRESFRAAAPTLPPVDIVVLAGPAAATADNASIFASLAEHWQRVAKRRDQQERTGKH